MRRFIFSVFAIVLFATASQCSAQAWLDDALNISVLEHKPVDAEVIEPPTVDDLPGEGFEPIPAELDVALKRSDIECLESAIDGLNTKLESLSQPVMGLPDFSLFNDKLDAISTQLEAVHSSSYPTAEAIADAILAKIKTPLDTAQAKASSIPSPAKPTASNPSPGSHITLAPGEILLSVDNIPVASSTKQTFRSSSVLRTRTNVQSCSQVWNPVTQRFEQKCNQ